MIYDNSAPPETVLEAAVYCVRFLRERNFPTPSMETAALMGRQFLRGETLVFTSSPTINEALDRIYKGKQ